MRIGDVELDSPVFLAPMAGVSDLPFRVLAREMGAGLAYTEMISDKGLLYKNSHTLAMLRSAPEERPLAAQLFGAEPDSLARAARLVEEDGAAAIVDINMGCPAPKVVKNGEGAALMRDPARASAILRAVVRAVSLPVTVKIRKGWDEGRVNAVEMARLAEEAGCAAVAVHGRTREAFYTGQADWEIVRQVKNSVSVPVIGNGDLRSPQDVKHVLDAGYCDAVMIGRAAQGNPWIFRRIKRYLAGGAAGEEPAPAERLAVMARHLAMLIEEKGEYVGVREMRKHAAWYTRGLKGAAELRASFNRAESRDDFFAAWAALAKPGRP